MHIRAILAAALGLALCAVAGPGWAAGALDTLTVRIENVSARGGLLHVGVYDEASYGSGAAPVLERAVKPVPGTMTVTFVGIAQGTYAVKVVQDVNANKALDRHLMGAAAEPVGYSNTAGLGGKPPFRAARFTVGTGDNAVIVRMRQ